MKISTPTRIDSFRIRKGNQILYYSQKDKVEFVKMFENVFSFKDDTIEMFINDTKVTSKEYLYLNLLDPKNYISNLHYSKNSLMYEYINTLLLEKDHDDLFHFIDSYFDKIRIDMGENIEFSYNDDIVKLFGSTINLETKRTDFEIYQLILNKILESQITKKVILLYDSDVFDFSILSDNVYSFDFSDSIEINDYNLLLINGIKEFNVSDIYEYVFRYYPINYDETVLMNSIQQYFRYFFRNKCLFVYDVSLLIIYKILSKNYGYMQEYDLNGMKLDNTILSFLTDF